MRMIRLVHKLNEILNSKSILIIFLLISIHISYNSLIFGNVLNENDSNNKNLNVDGENLSNKSLDNHESNSKLKKNKIELIFFIV